MDNISHALFSWSLLCFPGRVRFVISLCGVEYSCCWIIAGCLQFIPFELSFVYPDAWYRLSLFLVSHLLYTSVSLVSFPFEYIIHGLPVMNNMSHALFGWNPLLIFPSRVRFVFFVESNIHPLTSLCFGWWVFWKWNPIHVFGRSPIICPVTGISGVSYHASLLSTFRR